jgi:hypothetical protein
MLVTFKDLKKRVSLEVTQQQSRLFQRLHNKPFWIWDIQEHKQEDANTDGDCCFNHIIGLPQRNGVDKPLYDYEKIIFDSLVIQKILTISLLTIINNSMTVERRICIKTIRQWSSKRNVVYSMLSIKSNIVVVVLLDKKGKDRSTP